jgi:hypothetical protein
MQDREFQRQGLARGQAAFTADAFFLFAAVGTFE